MKALIFDMGGVLVDLDLDACRNAYKALGFDIADYPNAYNQYCNEVTLPLHTRLSDEDVEYVISNFVEIISQ